MGTLDPDKYQELLSAHDELDNVPVRLTRYQAQKCAAIISAGRDGHLTYAEETKNVARFFQAIAFEAGGQPFGTLSRIADDIWRELNDLPWPQPGLPKD